MVTLPTTDAPLYFVSTFYFFKSLENLSEIESEILEHGETHQILGLFILGTEGLNSTLSARSKPALDNFKEWLRLRFGQKDLLFKDSVSSVAPFPKLKVKVRPEIVTLGVGDLPRPPARHRHLSPAEWDKVLEEEKDVAILDTRNSYEYRIGSFKNAIDPKIEQFSDFPDFVDQQAFDKNKKILIFCTGGIRCEKGILELERRGYTNVYQLEGGILNYLTERPLRNFVGECFVFDNRVALTQELTPTTTYKLCPHCGQPAEVKIECVRCDQPGWICPACHSQDVSGKTCSKNCAHHAAREPGKKGLPQIPRWRLPSVQRRQNKEARS